MSSLNRLFACLRCTACRLNVPNIVLKQAKCSLWGNLLVDSRLTSAVTLPSIARAFSSECFSRRPVVRGYRTAPTETTGFDRDIYDENEVCTAVIHFHGWVMLKNAIDWQGVKCGCCNR